MAVFPGPSYARVPNTSDDSRDANTDEVYEDKWLRGDDDDGTSPPKRGQRTVSLKTFAATMGCCLFLFLAVCLVLASRPPVKSSGAQQNLAAGDGGGSDHSDAAAAAVAGSLGPDPATLFVVDTFTNATELDLRTGFVVSAVPTLREYDFVISHGLADPDGFRKPMILVNGQSPGPLIEANTGDTIRVRVRNRLSTAEDTALHWHGINQYGSPAMDGVVGVSQCGIPPGGELAYEFVVAGQRGTFWYHSHATVQRADGLYGPLVVHDPDELVPAAADDKILFVGDLYHAYGQDLRANYLGPGSRWSPHMAGVEPLADNIVVNGRGDCDCAVASSTLEPEPAAACGAGSAWVTTVRGGGGAVRLRLINHGAFFAYWFSIDSHVLTVVEMDGVEVEPIRVRGVYLNIGQRHSVLVEPDQPAGRYRMRADLVESCFLPYAGYNSSALESSRFRGEAVLEYEGGGGGGGNGDVDATTKTPFSGVPWNESNPSSADSLANPFSATEGCNDLPFSLPTPRRRQAAHKVSPANTHYVEFSFRQAQSINRPFVNKTAWQPLGDNATLWQVGQQDWQRGDGGGPYHSYGFGLDQQVLAVPDAGRGAQLVVNLLDGMQHPLHMHGHTFQVVGWGPGLFGGTVVDQRTNRTVSATRWRLDNPLRRDTVTVPANSHVVLRWVADNPGVWAVHCHVLWHSIAGMFVAMAERPSDLVGLLDGMAAEQRDAGQRLCGF